MTRALHLCVGPVLDIGNGEIGQKRVGGDELGPGEVPRRVGLSHDGCRGSLSAPDRMAMAPATPAKCVR